MIGWLRPGVLAILFLTLVVAIVPLPSVLSPLRPEACVLALLYWSLVAPRSSGLLVALIMGLALDALTGTVLGEHALGLVVICFLAQRFHLQLRSFPASQLVIVVALLLTVYEFLLFWIDGMLGVSVSAVARWVPVLSSSLVWLGVWYFVGGDRRAPAEL